jgi:putative transcriptional regulator
VAQALQITPQMLGAIERGSRTPSLALAKRIADYYSVSMDSIFSEANGHNPSPDGPAISDEAIQSA